MYFSLSKLFSSETREKHKGLFQLLNGDCKALKPQNIPALGGKNKRKEETRISFLQDSNIYCWVINKQKCT